MNKKELDRLLRKYYKGESTEDEEKALRLYFGGCNIPDGYEAEKVIFSYYTESVQIPEPSADFEARIIAGIEESEKDSSPINQRISFIPYLSIAAGLLIVVASYFFLSHRNEPRDTFSDPKIAYAETMKILFNVSSQLNQGAKALEPVAKMNEMTAKSFKAINRSTNIVEKNLKSLNYLQRAPEINKISSETK
jgi:hypothetical protein